MPTNNQEPLKDLERKMPEFNDDEISRILKLTFSDF
jgi:hypothetical protein